jgi:hypothetical protein
MNEILTTFSSQISLAAAGRRQFKARYVRAGKILKADRTPSKYLLRPAALESAVAAGLFDNKAVFIDHAGFFENPSIKNLCGTTQEAAYNAIDQAVEGIIKLSNTLAGKSIAALLDELLEDGSQAPDIGLSLVFYPTWEGNEIAAINHVESVDLVFQPAADGRILKALSAFRTENPMEVITMSEIKEPYQVSSEPTEPVAIPGAASSPVNPADNPNVGEWNSLMATYSARQVILASGLPQVSQERLLEGKYANAGECATAIEKERAYLAALTEQKVVNIGSVPPRGAQITGMRTGVDQLTLAFEALIAGTRPPDGIQPLTGIREMYHLLSGDYELTGIFHGERIYLANVNSSTMANLVANALNKIVINEFQEYPRWWEPILSVQDFNSLQAIKWISLGGIGELPTVAEGAAYTELTWDDNYETASFVKKGGYLGITLETIDKDDTGKVRQAPRALAQAAWLTLSKAISTIFTTASGAGPNLVDGYALFESAHHANLGTTALSITEFNVVRTAMRKQTELNSSERLGALTAPKFLLVPPDLEMTALQVLASEYQYTYALSNAPAAPSNVYSEGSTHDARLAYARSRVIVVDLWTDTNNWAAVCDPRMYPTIGLGFRYGRQPEIFSVASPLAGLMFSNDTLPVKVRFFYAVGPMDYRGMYKENVA